MKRIRILPLIVALMLGSSAAAEQLPKQSYEFLVAKMAAAEGRLDEALSRMDRVIAANPADPILLFERALILMESGRVERAESELRAVIRAFPQFNDAYRVAGQLLVERAANDRQKMDEAVRYLQKAFAVNPDDLASGVTLSRILVASGRTAEAEKVLATLVERAPDQRVINYNYAQVLTKLGRGNESKPYLERAVALDPTFAPAILQLVDIYEKEQDYAKAAELLQPAIDQEPMNIELQRQQAYYHLRSGQADKSVETFRRLAAADPKDRRAQFFLAESLTELSEHGEAEAIYRRLLELDPNDFELLTSFGVSQVAQRKYDEAQTTFKRILAAPKVPDNLAALARTQLALIALQHDRYDEAIELARPVFVFRDKPNAQAVNIALEALRKQKRFSDALTLLKPLVDAHGTDAFVNARYVEMLVRSGDTKKAQQVAATQAKLGARNVIATSEALVQAEEYAAATSLLSEAITTKPDEIDLRFQLGSAHERAGDRAAAERAFLDLLEKEPEHAPTLNYLGYMWAEAGTNLDRAADMLTRAVRQEPRNGAYIDSLGWVYFQQGKLDLAEKHLKDAVRLVPRDATVKGHLADVYARRGDLKRALELYREALTFEPDSKEEAKLKSKIAELERKVR